MFLSGLLLSLLKPFLCLFLVLHGSLEHLFSILLAHLLRIGLLLLLVFLVVLLVLLVFLLLLLLLLLLVLPILVLLLVLIVLSSFLQLVQSQGIVVTCLFGMGIVA